MAPCPPDHLLCHSTRSPYLTVIAAVLDAVVRESATRGGMVTKFDARTQPTVSLVDYLRRWARYTRCGAVCVVAAVVFIDRACMKNGIMVTGMNVHRLLLAALLVACKVHADTPFSNAHYSMVGGVSLSELNKLEREFLVMLDFDCSVTKKDMAGYDAMFRNHRAWPDDIPAEPEPETRRQSVESSENGLSDSGASELRSARSRSGTPPPEAEGEGRGCPAPRRGPTRVMRRRGSSFVQSRR